ncbi:MAG: HEAT repeat domain-containing protein [Geobacteraceae bacterium]|nr:HEAT repeat domain-containing protein [Geobacteraceae bacterium]
MKQSYPVIMILLVAATLQAVLQPYPASADNSAEIRRLIGKFTSLEQKAAVKNCALYGDEAVPVLMASLASAVGSGEIEINVVRALGTIGTPLAIDSLTKLILRHRWAFAGSQKYNVAIECAVKTLESLGPAGERALIRSLANKDKQVHYLVISALARIGDATAVSGLISDLPNIHAAKALGKFRDPRTVAALVATLPAPQAIVALGEINDSRAIVPLLRVPHNGKNFAAEEALTNLGIPLLPFLHDIASQIPKNNDLDEQQAAFTDSIVRKLVSNKLHERYLAEVVIVRIGRLMVPSLIKALGSSNDSHQRRTAAELLGKMQGPGIENALTKALQDKNPLVVAHAARALGELGNQSALGPLAMVAKRGSPYERRGAAWAIAKIGTPAATTVLKDLCHDKDEYVRKIAVRGLAGR